MKSKKLVSSAEEAVFDDSIVDVAEATDENEIIATSSLNLEAQEQKRLSKRPDISHLKDATDIDPETGSLLVLFKTGDRIVADRRAPMLKGAPWLDTRVYIVHSIDEASGVIRCIDEVARHHAYIGLRDPFTKLKLAPKMGNPFNAKEVKKMEKKLAEVKRTTVGASGTAVMSVETTTPKKRGRPKGTKNRSREVILAEKATRRLEKIQKAEAKKLAKSSKSAKRVVLTKRK